MCHDAESMWCGMGWVICLVGIRLGAQTHDWCDGDDGGSHDATMGGVYWMCNGVQWRYTLIISRYQSIYLLTRGIPVGHEGSWVGAAWGNAGGEAVDCVWERGYGRYELMYWLVYLLGE